MQSLIQPFSPSLPLLCRAVSRWKISVLKASPRNPYCFQESCFRILSAYQGALVFMVRVTCILVCNYCGIYAQVFPRCTMQPCYRSYSLFFRVIPRATAYCALPISFRRSIPLLITLRRCRRTQVSEISALAGIQSTRWNLHDVIAWCGPTRLFTQCSPHDVYKGCDDHKGHNDHECHDSHEDLNSHKSHNTTSVTTIMLTITVTTATAASISYWLHKNPEVSAPRFRSSKVGAPSTQSLKVGI